MNRWAVTAALLSLFSLLASEGVLAGQRPVPAFTEREDDGGLARAVMRNGLILLAEEHVAGPVGTVGVRIEFGALDAPEAPLAAELLARRLARKLAAEVRGLGGLLAVRVYPRHTLFITTAADSNVFRAVQAQAVLLGEPEDDGQLPLDLAILQGRATESDSPYGRAETRLKELVFAPPASESGGGAAEPGPLLSEGTPYSVESLDQLQRQHYRPANTVISASGNIRRERIFREAVRSMAGVAPGEGSGVDSTEQTLPPGNDFRFVSESAAVRQNYVFFGYPVPDQRHADRDALELLTFVLGHGRGALLRIPRPETGHPPYTVRVHLTEGSEGHLLQITTVPWPGQIDATEIQILTAIETLLARGIPAAELDRAKAQWLREHYAGLERVDDRAVLLATYERRGSFKMRDAAPARIASLTAAQLLEVGRRYLRRDRMAVLEVLTSQESPRTFSSASFLETVDLLIPEQRKKELALLESLRVDQKEPQFQLPEFKTRYSRPTLRQTAILRGPDIWIRERHLLPVATVGFFFSGGPIQESGSTTGITETMFRALLRSLTRRDDGLRYHRLERGGVNLEPVFEKDYFGLRIMTLSRQLNDVVTRITNWLRDPDTAIEAMDLDAARNAILAENRHREDSRPHDLRTAVARELYADHPYGAVISSLSSLQVSQVQSWADRQLVNVHPYLLVLGDFEGTSFLSGLISQLSDRRYEVRNRFDRPFNFADDSLGRAATAENVLMAVPGPEAHTYSRQALEVAGWLLGGWHGIISRSLREEKLANRFELWADAGLNGGGVYLQVEADPARSREAADALIKKLNGLDSSALRQDDFFDALVATITGRHLAVEDSRWLLDDLMLAVLSGEDASYRSREEGIIKSLTPAETLSVARRYFVFPE